MNMRILFSQSGLLGAVLAVTSLTAPAQSTTDPTLPTVRVEATQPIAEEDSLPFDRFPLVGEFTLARTGPTDAPLPVFVALSGTATADVDYPTVPWIVSIPAGAATVAIRIVPTTDNQPEGLETVVARISNCPPDPRMAMPCYGFEVDPAHATATVFIRDDGITTAALRLTQPADGSTFAAGATIAVEAIAIDLDGYIDRVEFWDGKQLLGASQIDFFRAPDPGTPIQHLFAWGNAAVGAHELTAHAVASSGLAITSNPVHLTVEGEPPRPLVRIDATRTIAEESSYPYRRLPFVGEFTLSRTGPTNTDLPVFVEYDGTATAGADYPILPWSVTIPAGAASTVLRVPANPDTLDEGIETLVATVANCPPLRDPPMGLPCSAFDVDRAHARATVFLRDDGQTVASLALVSPKDGASFVAGDPIPCRAVAIDLDGYISRVEFWADGQRIGVSQVVFVRAPEPGTPISHSFVWADAPAGPHVLTARAVSTAGVALSANRVQIQVESTPQQPPKVAITRPADGAEFPFLTPIEIAAEAADADGWVRRVDFFADGRKIGEVGADMAQATATALGQAQTFVFRWRWATPGAHVLTAVATDNTGLKSTSAAVAIRVTEPAMVPCITVVAADPFAVEPGVATVLNTATFRVRRFGPTNAGVVVSYSLHGSAENGVDYENLTGIVLIPGGQRFADIVVRPLQDGLPERLESVILQLEPSPLAGPMPTYQIGMPSRAVAVISDSPIRVPVAVNCRTVGDRVLDLCFGADSALPFRIEASRDLRLWETVSDALPVDGAVHVVDEDVPDEPQRFYRLSQ